MITLKINYFKEGRKEGRNERKEIKKGNRFILIERKDK